MKIMLSAGEVSGDLHGEELARAVLSLAPETELIGFGGEKMAAAGVRIVRNFADYNVMGILEVLKNLRRLKGLLDDLTAFMRKERPDLLVLIDYPDFNWRLAKRAKVLGIPVFSYIPPSAWAWRKGRARTCAAIADEFVAIFPHELLPYQKAKARISFVGNPLVDSVKAELPPEKARAFFGVSAHEHIILLMPGSRKQEIELLLPAMLGAAKLLLKKRPETKFFLPVGKENLAQRIEMMTEETDVPVRFVHENRYALMGLADAAIATSGTVVMEACLMELPCVSLYKLRFINYLIGRLLVHVDAFTLPNILAGHKFQPELLQGEVTPERIAEETLKLYKGEPVRARVQAELRRAAERLGPSGAAERIAQKILACAERNRTNDFRSKETS